MKLRGKKQEAEVPAADSATPAGSGALRDLAGGDEELYQALYRLMLLDPAKIKTPFDNIIKEAQDFEASGDLLRAEQGYRAAGGLALHKGDVDGVKTYFSKASALSHDSKPEYATIVKQSQRAVELARRYYENTVQIRLSVEPKNQP